MLSREVVLDKHLKSLFPEFRNRGPRRRDVVAFGKRGSRRLVEDVEDAASTRRWRLVMTVTADGG